MRKLPVLALILAGFPSLGNAADMIQMKSIGMELARDIASEAVLACRKKGYQVSAVVVDRNGNLRAAMRDDIASRFTLEIAERKANMVIMSGVASGDFRASREDIRPELNHIHGLIVMEGGLPIEAGGSRIGAVGVSGAPGGNIDASCAAAALDKLEDRLAFIE